METLQKVYITGKKKEEEEEQNRDTVGERQISITNTAMLKVIFCF